MSCVMCNSYIMCNEYLATKMILQECLFVLVYPDLYLLGRGGSIWRYGEGFSVWSATSECQVSRESYGI